MVKFHGLVTIERGPEGNIVSDQAAGHSHGQVPAGAMPEETLHPFNDDATVYTVAHFRRFLTVLEHSPIGAKFSPTTTPSTLYTAKKINSKIFKTFFCFESFKIHK